MKPYGVPRADYCCPGHSKWGGNKWVGRYCTQRYRRHKRPLRIKCKRRFRSLMRAAIRKELDTL